MKTLKFKTIDEFQTQVTSFDRVELAECVMDAIQRGLKNNNKKVSICDVEIEDDEDVFRLYSSQEDWPVALKSCMEVFIKAEEYEKCIVIQELQKDFEIKKLIESTKINK